MDDEHDDLFSVDNQNIIIVKKNTKINRLKGPRKEIYEKERGYVLLQMNYILNLTKDNFDVCMDEIDDELGEKRKEILKCIPDIKKYYYITKWTYFKTNSIKISLLIKNFYSSLNYNVSTYRIIENNIKVTYMKLKK
jgi:hypothetical protein